MTPNAMKARSGNSSGTSASIATEEETMDPISEARIKDVHPLLAEKIRTMAAMLEQEGIIIRVVQAFRTWAEQQALYEQGRSRAGKIVTNCPGGHSYHNFGLAVDCVPSIGGVDQSYQPDW